MKISETSEYYTVKRIKGYNSNMSFSENKLQKTSIALNLPALPFFDKHTYHSDVWKTAYPKAELPFSEV